MNTMAMLGTFVKFNLILTILTLCYLNAVADGYRIGVGRADCTGPPVEVVFMGYAQVSQKGHGLHLRQYSRAFIVDDNAKRVVFVSFDGAMIGHTVKRDVVSMLQKQYGKQYTLDNVVISGTHTHSTPGGFMMNLLYDLTTFGFVGETYRALVDGIFNSVVNAHNTLQNGRIYIGETEVLEANINRSPSSYLFNPEEERSQFQYDTDKTLTQIRFVSEDNNIIGAINWFAVHPTSMNNTNHFVSSDNVGYAAILLEQQMNPENLPGRGKFVGAFASANLGDVSPNIMGPKCALSGEKCDLFTSSCPAKHGQCFASGPGKDHFESTKIIATRLFEGAWKIIKESSGREISGNVNFVHQFVDMPAYRTTYFNPKKKRSENVRGCLPAMGYSFAAGTTDGPGAFDFTQGTTTDNPLWNAVRDFLAAPTQDDIKCQFPKPILLSTGRASFPYEWQPKTVSTQLLQIGDVILAAVPGEFTTMSGRRLRQSVRNAILQAGGDDVQVIVAGLSNMYSSYVATPEEYQAQRYEAASTIFGPHTLTIYIDQFQNLCQAMVKNESILPGPTPPFLDNKVISFQPTVLFDTTPSERKFGDVLRQPNEMYKTGDQVTVLFVSGNPRNNLQHEKTYLTVEYQTANGDWKIVAVDSNWETKFMWKRTSFILGHSTTEIMWDIPETADEGNYRIRHYGSARHIFGGFSQYEGTSDTFAVYKGGQQVALL